MPLSTGTASTFVLSDDDYQRAERIWRAATLEDLDPAILAAEIDFWTRQRDRWQGDLLARDPAIDETVFANGVAYAEQKLRELLREAQRIERLQCPPDPLHPREDLTPRFRAAKYVDLVGIAETFGLAPRKRGSHYLLSCPFHDGDREPSLTIYPPGRGWHCFGCGKGGDAVAFVAELRRCGAVEALRWIEQVADTYPEAWGAA
jgi:hypothetical protein